VFLSTVVSDNTVPNIKVSYRGLQAKFGDRSHISTFFFQKKGFGKSDVGGIVVELALKLKFSFTNEDIYDHRIDFDFYF